jgi:hypothetical protein
MEDTKDISFRISMGLMIQWNKVLQDAIWEIPEDNPDLDNMSRIVGKFNSMMGHRRSWRSPSDVSCFEFFDVTFNMLAFLDMTLRRVEKILEDSDNPQYGPELREIAQIKKQLEYVVIAW